MVGVAPLGVVAPFLGGPPAVLHMETAMVIGAVAREGETQLGSSLDYPLLLSVVGSSSTCAVRRGWSAGKKSRKRRRRLLRERPS